MPTYFSFTDTPQLGDQWETTINLDVLMHTRPALIEQRDRFARAYNTRYAAEELSMGIYRGLRDFGYETFDNLDRVLIDEMWELTTEADHDSRVANDAEIAPERPEADECIKRFRECQRALLRLTLDNELMTRRFVRDLACELDTLNPGERMRRIYGLRGARLVRHLPYHTNAADILARAFSSGQVIKNHDAPGRDIFDESVQREYKRLLVEEDDASTALVKALEFQKPDSPPENLDLEEVAYAVIADVVDTVAHRIENDADFADAIIDEWVLPELDARFDHVDARLDTMWIDFLDGAEDIDGDMDDEELQRRCRELRQRALANGRADDEWLALAAGLGNPLPEETLNEESDEEDGSDD